MLNEIKDIWKKFLVFFTRVFAIIGIGNYKIH